MNKRSPRTFSAVWPRPGEAAGAIPGTSAKDAGLLPGYPRLWRILSHIPKRPRMEPSITALCSTRTTPLRVRSNPVTFPPCQSERLQYGHGFREIRGPAAG
jgi:hypothetical protein